MDDEELSATTNLKEKYFNRTFFSTASDSGRESQQPNLTSQSDKNSSSRWYGSDAGYPDTSAEDENTKLFSIYRVIFNESDYMEAAHVSDHDDDFDLLLNNVNSTNSFSAVNVTTFSPPTSKLTQSSWSASTLPNLATTVLGDLWSAVAVPSTDRPLHSDHVNLDPTSMLPTSILDLEVLSLNLLNSTLGPQLITEPNGSILEIVNNSITTLTYGSNFTTLAATNATYGPSSSVYSLYEVIFISLVTIILSLATLIGNLMVMISFKIDKQLQTISNYFLFSLAVADITIGIISMPLFTLYTLLGYWPLGPHVCDTWLALDYLASNASVLNLLIISFDRYFSVTRPLTYRAKRTTRRAAVMISSAWIISLILWPPWIYSWPYIEGGRTVPEGQCYIQFIETNEIITVVTAIAAFYLPVTVMCSLYWRIWRETEKRQKDLTNLQAGKKDPSKRSNSRKRKLIVARRPGLALVQSTVLLLPGVPILPDPTSYTDTAVSKSEAEECPEPDEWRRQRSESSTAMEEIETTYVPTAMVIDNSKFAVKKSKYGCCRGLASCIKRTVDREEINEVKHCKKSQGCHTPGFNTPGYHTPSYHTGGYHTPGSVETTMVPSVSRCPSINYIKESSGVVNNRFRQDSMIPLVERSPFDRLEQRSYSHYGHHTASTLPRAESSMGLGTRAAMGGRLHARSYSSDSVYTILIRLPHDPTPDGPLHPPSILMIEEEGDAGGLPKGVLGETVIKRYNRGSSPMPRGVDSICSDPGGEIGPTPRLVDYSLHVGGAELAAAVLPRRSTSINQDIKLPLNAKIIPKQLAKSTNSAGSGSGSGGNSCATGTTGRKKKKKKSTEKKQDRKAAKTLSAILFAFIVTWTPYNVLVILKSLLSCNDCIPHHLWMFAYYLCYVNSTVNPMCYALCNAAFRRTYVRILTCKWHNRRKQGVQRGYYS